MTIVEKSTESGQWPPVILIMHFSVQVIERLVLFYVAASTRLPEPVIEVCLYVICVT